MKCPWGEAEAEAEAEGSYANQPNSKRDFRSHPSLLFSFDQPLPSEPSANASSKASATAGEYPAKLLLAYPRTVPPRSMT